MPWRIQFQGISPAWDPTPLTFSDTPLPQTLAMALSEKKSIQFVLYPTPGIIFALFEKIIDPVEKIWDS